MTRPWSHGARVVAVGFVGVVPALLVAVWFSLAPPGGSLAAVVVVAALLWCVACLAVQHRRVVGPLQTLANVLGAVRHGDYSLRAHGARGDDALGLAVLELNALADILHEQRLGVLETTALLRKVMDEIDVAVLAFDDERALRLINRAGERVLGRPIEQLRGRSADSLGLDGALGGEARRIVEAPLAGAAGRWELRRSTFRQRGRRHQLLVLSDLSRALREEERLAWQRLVRVLGHEINNSLAPIQSIAASLAAARRRTPRAADWEEDLDEGLDIIARRADGLRRFLAAYSRLARLPPPTLRPLAIGPLVRRVAGLEHRVPVQVIAGPELHLEADGDQLEQLLINLVTNAADATIERTGGVEVTWARVPGHLIEICVRDEGPGLAGTSNLFVPFFSTKPGGSGIGLLLCRQIAEAHGGSLTLQDRSDRAGCEARVRLPFTAGDEHERGAEADAARL